MTTETRIGPSGWAGVAGLVVLVGAGALLVWFVNAFFGATGVRIVAIVLGLMVVFAFIACLGFGMMWAASRLLMRHHDNVLQGLVDFQAADDRGEVVRALANSQRTGNQLEGKILTLAGQLGRQQAGAIIGAANNAQRQLTAQDAGAPTWANRADVDAMADFRVVE